jgi:hypothetical protein
MWWNCDQQFIIWDTPNSQTYLFRIEAVMRSNVINTFPTWVFFFNRRGSHNTAAVALCSSGSPRLQEFICPINAAEALQGYRHAFLNPPARIPGEFSHHRQQFRMALRNQPLHPDNPAESQEYIGRVLGSEAGSVSKIPFEQSAAPLFLRGLGQF